MCAGKFGTKTCGAGLRSSPPCLIGKLKGVDSDSKLSPIAHGRVFAAFFHWECHSVRFEPSLVLKLNLRCIHTTADNLPDICKLMTPAALCFRSHVSGCYSRPCYPYKANGLKNTVLLLSIHVCLRV
ncbi:hypothetical protein GBAR_LOCUS10423 [Geodia barretti]|uniref:Uncharacterized protein n=1 Tax=Geodia barretti TaxID=519541 RepID=A0AA35RTP6_GEOBA|nr:hypothetical protein GBAR_LOCUS10423 [Geodia barretti]